MPRARWGHTSSFIHNKLILCGGIIGDTVRVAPSDTCDIYSLTSRGWKHGLKMETGRHSAAGIPVLGRMYVIGGQTQTGPTDSMEVYDPSHDTWTHGPQMPQAVSRPCAVVFRDVIILSGGSFTDKAGNTVETNQVLVFNVTSQTWTKTTPMKQARAGHGCSLNVRPTTHSEPIYEIIVTGGEFEDESLATAEVFTIQDKQWTDFPSLPFKLSDQVHIQSGQSRPGLLGGLLTGVASPLVLHLTEEDGWKLAEYALPKGLAGHSVTDFPRQMVDC